MISSFMIMTNDQYNNATKVIVASTRFVYNMFMHTIAISSEWFVIAKK